MNYKEFYIKTNCNKHLVKAAFKHLKKLGYKDILSHPALEEVDFINAYDDGDFQLCVDCGVTKGEKISLEEFFSLTAETVKVKPEPKTRTHLIVEDLTGDEFADVEHLINKIKEERES